jgi:hypothetical protein
MRICRAVLARIFVQERAARRVRTRRGARSRIRPAPTNATIAAAAMLWPVFQHPQASGAHADLLAVPVGWSGWPICGHLRARELRRLTILTVAAAERPSSGTAVPAALGRRYATRRSCFAGCPARDVVTALLKRFGSSRTRRWPSPERSLRHCPGYLPATAGTGRRSRGQSGYRRTEDRPR